MPRKKKTPESCTEFWAGSFGKEYTERNQVHWQDRVAFLRRMIEATNAQTFLDVGCNAGWNMMALREISSEFMMTGIDVNDAALDQAFTAGFDVMNCAAKDITPEKLEGYAQMAITSGVLIHVPPEDLQATMRSIAECASQYVLAIEYAGDNEEVEYRGHAGRLWKRNYGLLYANMGLSLVEYGQAEGYDQCQYWLLEKS